MLMVQQFLPHLKTRKGALIVNVSSGLAFIPFPAAGLLRHEGCNSFVHSIPACTNGGHGRNRGRSGSARRRDAAAARRVRGGNEGAEGDGCEGPRQARDFRYRGGQAEMRPGLANVLMAMSRIAPGFMLKQMAKMAKPKRVSRQPMKRVSSL